jgi:hypothetical protein
VIRQLVQDGLIKIEPQWAQVAQTRDRQTHLAPLFARN